MADNNITIYVCQNVKQNMIGENDKKTEVSNCRTKLTNWRNKIKSTDVKYFSPEEEYNRYIIGRFKDEALVPNLLKDYSELCTDSPKISEYDKQEEWVIIPCPTQLINRGCFLDLAGWLSQKGDKVFAVAIHANKSYFSKPEKGNKWGDTAIVGFDDGITLRWLYPDGFVNDSACYAVDPETLDPEDMMPWPCKEFLYYVGAEKLIKHFYK